VYCESWFFSIRLCCLPPGLNNNNNNNYNNYNNIIIIIIIRGKGNGKEKEEDVTDVGSIGNGVPRVKKK